MKKVYTVLFLSFATLLATGQNIFQTNQLTKTNEAVPQDWYGKAANVVEEKQNSFKAMENKTFAVVNSDNGIGSVVTPAGYTIKNIASKREDKWEAAFQLKSFNGRAFDVADPSVTVAARRLAYHSGNCTVEYINTKEGFGQNFIITEKDKNADGITIGIAVKSSLKATIHNNKLQLNDSKGQSKLLYDGLKAWDANNKPLEAKMELSGNNVIITVKDPQASYPVTIDPLNHTPAWSDNGDGLLFPLLNDATLHLMYGYSVSNAGDINGDGFADVVIGVPEYVDIVSVVGGTYNLVSVGAAFVYYGSPTGLAANPNEVLQSTTFAGAFFGHSVSNAGDVNGDGYADVVVGAPGDHITLNVGVSGGVATSVAVGKVYVYYGGPTGVFDGNINTQPTASATLSLDASDFGTLLTTPVNPQYGFSVSSAGDVNGDGKSDVVVGSPSYTRLLPTPLVSGRVDIFYGSTTGLASTPSQTITGTLLSALFGFSVSTAGNVNNDKNAGRNIDDIIVGAPGDLTFLGAGQAYIFNGSTSGITATTASGANRVLGSGLLTTLFGFSVSDAGDVNGDGYGDVIVGEPGDLENVLGQLVSVGSARIFYGSATGIKTIGYTKLTSPRAPSVLGSIEGNLLFGYSVSGTGDVNCDGMADVIVGEPGGTGLSLGSGLLGLISTEAISGKAYIYNGRPAVGPSNTPGYTIQETGAVAIANLLGASVSSAGDINGDGKLDILVGAPNGTLSLQGSLIPAIGGALGIITNNSIGSSYIWSGCTATTLPVSLTAFELKKRLPAYH